MNLFFLLLLAALALLSGYLVWQKWELKQFQVSHYEISTPKLKEGHRFVALADLHGFSYGNHNERLLAAVEKEQPELILIAGDMIVSKYAQTYPVMLATLKRLTEIAPVYYVFGNHESKADRSEKNQRQFHGYVKEAERYGVHFLRNENDRIMLGADEIALGGLELNLGFYVKGYAVPMEEGYVEEQMGDSPGEVFQILLAHNPMYSEQYAAWGADLTLCGHNHGGLIRFPGGRSLLSPQLTLFPKYNSGLYEIAGKHVLVSRGLGTHTFHIRIFNRAELVSVRLNERYSSAHAIHKKCS